MKIILNVFSLWVFRVCTCFHSGYKILHKNPVLKYNKGVTSHTTIIYQASITHFFYLFLHTVECFMLAGYKFKILNEKQVWEDYFLVLGHDSCHSMKIKLMWGEYLCFHRFILSKHYHFVFTKEFFNHWNKKSKF